jgi:DNA-3-methyladenine glycosylase
MPPFERLPRSFFNRPTITVARQLLGQRLVRIEGGLCISGLITEVEAYVGETDLACHARAGKTKRTTVMYGPPGHLYVYFTYGLHWMLNIVTERDGYPAAVLLRGLWPEEGQTRMRRRRGRPDHLTDGPARLAQAFGLDGRWTGADLCAADADVFLAAGQRVPPAAIKIGPRVGLGRTPEPWLSRPWNFSYAPGLKR